MVDVCLLTFELCFFLFISKRKNWITCILFIYSISFLPQTVMGDRTAFIDMQKIQKNGHKVKLSDDVFLQTTGVFAKTGSVKRAEGTVHQVSLF